MTAEIVNLNKFRKAKERADARKIAGENRQRFGLSKDTRAARDAEKTQTSRVLDGAKRQADDDELDPGSVS